MKFDPIPDVVDDVRRGKPVVVVDDSDRENEGDLCLAAELVTPDSIAFMIREGRGLICLSLEGERLTELRIPMQVSENQNTFGTNFAVSIDHVSVAEAGVTASGRAVTIRRSVSDDASPDEFRMPGYVFPLRAQPGGVLRRRGQTEAIVDLARLAGLKPAGVICEIMGPDGTMCRGESLEQYRRRWNLKMTSVEELVQFRLRNEASLRRVAECSLADVLGVAGVRRVGLKGEFRAIVYVDDVDDQEHIAFVRSRFDLSLADGALVRVHSECLTGDVFGSRRCDCGLQLKRAFSLVEEVGEGAVLYLHQEGRGIGLGNKLRAYALQDRGFDTVDANAQLGFSVDCRNYRVAAQMLTDLGARSVRLLTNNPDKVRSLADYGIAVRERVPLVIPSDRFNRSYLDAKRDRMGHLLP